MANPWGGPTGIRRWTGIRGHLDLLSSALSPLYADHDLYLIFISPKHVRGPSEKENQWAAGHSLDLGSLAENSLTLNSHKNLYRNWTQTGTEQLTKESSTLLEVT